MVGRNGQQLGFLTGIPHTEGSCGEQKAPSLSAGHHLWASLIMHQFFLLAFIWQADGGKNINKSHPHPSSLLEVLTCENGLREGKENSKTSSTRTVWDSFEQSHRSESSGGRREEPLAATANTSGKPAQPPPALLASHIM